MSDAVQDRSSGFGRAKNLVSQHRAAVVTGLLGLAAAAFLLEIMLHTASQPPAKQPPVIQMVVVQPPKPPPPPPPLPQPKMITQPKETMPEQKPMIPNQPPKPAPPRAAPSAPALGTSIHSNGAPDSFNLGGTPGGDCIGCGPGGGPGGGSYEGAVAADIEAALVANPVTRYASAGLRVRIWVNANGVVQRVALAASSGSPAVDTAIVNQILPGMTLPQPPAGTPMPMLVSLTGEQQAQ